MNPFGMTHQANMLRALFPSERPLTTAKVTHNGITYWREHGVWRQAEGVGTRAGDFARPAPDWLIDELEKRA